MEIVLLGITRVSSEIRRVRLHGLSASHTRTGPEVGLIDDHYGKVVILLGEAVIILGNRRGG